MSYMHDGGDEAQQAGGGDGPLTRYRGGGGVTGVTGEIKHGRLVAVMGPSGSGKSTFLNALAGRASYGTIGGTVRVNNEVADMRDFRCNIGFVPQVPSTKRCDSFAPSMKYTFEFGFSFGFKCGFILGFNFRVLGLTALQGFWFLGSDFKFDVVLVGHWHLRFLF